MGVEYLDLKKYLGCLLGAACVMLAGEVSAKEYVVGQKNKSFSTVLLKVKLGDTVNFINKDPYFHNVFSLSDAKSFDLGSYPIGEGRKVTFDKPGRIYVECAIHPSMKMIIDVLPP